MKQVFYMVMFGKYTETIRHFHTTDEAYDFIVEVIRRTKQIHHSKVDASWIHTQASGGSANVYEIYFGEDKIPQRLKKTRMKEEFTKRGLKKTLYGFWE